MSFFNKAYVISELQARSGNYLREKTKLLQRVIADEWREAGQKAPLLESNFVLENQSGDTVFTLKHPYAASVELGTQKTTARPFMTHAIVKLSQDVQ